MVSISSTFYVVVFHTKVLRARKMLMKLTKGVDFINIYARDFRTKFWRQKFQPKVQLTYKILATKTRFRTKNVRIKCWWNWPQVLCGDSWGNFAMLLGTTAGTFLVSLNTRRFGMRKLERLRLLIYVCWVVKVKRNPFTKNI